MIGAPSHRQVVTVTSPHPLGQAAAASACPSATPLDQLPTQQAFATATDRLMHATPCPKLAPMLVVRRLLLLATPPGLAKTTVRVMRRRALPAMLPTHDPTGQPASPLARTLHGPMPLRPPTASLGMAPTHPGTARMRLVLVAAAWTGWTAQVTAEWTATLTADLHLVTAGQRAEEDHLVAAALAVTSATNAPAAAATPATAASSLTTCASVSRRLAVAPSSGRWTDQRATQ